MSDEQLSWENLLTKDRGPDEKSAPHETAAGTKLATQSAAKSVRVKVEKPESRTRLSEQNWSKLEFPKKKSAAVDSIAADSAAPATQVGSAPAAKNAAPAKSVETTIDGVGAATADPEADDLAQESSEPSVITVSELNRAIKDLLEGEFPTVWIKGEISNFKAHTSGHFYFSLKDSKAQISAVMFRGFNTGLKFRPADGMEVIVRGRVTVYEPRGNYQIFCELMEPVGAGALQKAYEQLKAKLQAEGLFDQSRKRPLPSLPRHIAIVTSPTGAAIRDMLNVLGRRFKGAHITVIPTKVQGDQAPAEIVAAIALANQLADVDVMIVGRGGGSIEDLWAFNDERVVRAIASARVPVISAVGHEVDFTIADFVADLRAPTPSAAAELVVKNAADLADRVAGLQRSLLLSTQRHLQMSRQAVLAATRRLVDPQRRLQDVAIRLDELAERLENSALRFVGDLRLRIELLKEKLGSPDLRLQHSRHEATALEMRLINAMKSLVTSRRERVVRDMAVLDSLSPLKVVERGYSFVTVGAEIVKDVDQVKPGELVRIQFARGMAAAEIKEIIHTKNSSEQE